MCARSKIRAKLYTSFISQIYYCKNYNFQIQIKNLMRHDSLKEQSGQTNHEGILLPRKIGVIHVYKNARYQRTKYFIIGISHQFESE
jgi:hypothetical protein